MLEKNVVERIGKIVDDMKDGVVDLTSELVRIPSVNPSYLGINRDEVLGGEKKCNEFLASRIKDMGCKIDLWEVVPERANLAAVFKGTGGGRSIILTGHIDVVPPGNLKVWKTHPFSGIVKEGKVWGRGSSDCKGGLAVAIYAIRAIQRLGLKLKGDVIFASTVGEETGEGGAEGMAPAGAVSMISRGYKADAAVFVEQYDGIWVTQPHFLWLKITVEGKSAHCAFRDEIIHAGGKGQQMGVSAIDKGFKIYDALRELERQWGITKQHPLLPKGHFTMGANVVRGGPGELLNPYIIPDNFTLDYGIWAHPDEKVENVKKEIEDYIDAVARTDDWLKDHKPKLEWKLWWGPFNTPLDHPIVKTVSDAFESVTGKKPALTGCLGVLDCCFLEAYGIPSISHGAGGAGMDTEHAENEFVEIKDLIRATKVLALSVLDWCGYEE